MADTTPDTRDVTLKIKVCDSGYDEVLDAIDGTVVVGETEQLTALLRALLCGVASVVDTECNESAEYLGSPAFAEEILAHGERMARLARAHGVLAGDLASLAAPRKLAGVAA